MSNFPTVILTRDVDATLIPVGTKIYLQKDTEVVITQELGGSFTVNIYGNLARIDGHDADALGRVAVDPLDELKNATLEEKIWAQMKTCYDPEIPVNIVDLGLVYHCDIKENDQGKTVVDIDMTLTAPGCGMGPVLTDDVRTKILKIPEITEVTVNLVFDPPWDQSKLSDCAKLALGLL